MTQINPETSSAHADALAISALPEAAQDRAIALAACIRWLTEGEFSAADLNFILVIITSLTCVRPAALFAQLGSVSLASDQLPPATPSAEFQK